MWVRVWHRLLLAALPDPPPDQWSERGVVAATASWQQVSPEIGIFPGAAGAEIDLANAYDSVRLDAAKAAILHAGAPRPVAALLAASWKAPRHCHVQGELSVPLCPCCGLLAGDPCSLRVLALILKPWHERISKEVPEVRTWAYVDDRSIKAAPSNDSTPVEDQATHVRTALEVTDDFDSAIGLTENKKKRQVWEGLEAVEHLGIITGGMVDPELGLDQVTIPGPRDGWDPIADVTKRLSWIPGSISRRLWLFDMCITPKFAWAAPFAEIPNEGVAEITAWAMQAAVGTSCTWWCNRRFWADNINRHPPTAVALRAIKAASIGLTYPSRLASATLHKAAAQFSCEIAHASPEHGVWLRPYPNTDQRFIERAAVAASRSHWPPTVDQTRLRGAFQADTSEGLHTLRTAARASLLKTRTAASKRRFDEEGLDDIDTEASSHPLWKDYVRKLNFRMKAQLDIWRGGAVWTPTRRFSCPNGQSGSESHPSQLTELHPPPTSVRNKEARD